MREASRVSREEAGGLRGHRCHGYYNDFVVHPIENNRTADFFHHRTASREASREAEAVYSPLGFEK